MKAVAVIQSRPIEAVDSLLDIDLPPPELTEHDLLVNVRAVSVNPVDTRTRAGRYQGSAADNTHTPRRAPFLFGQGMLRLGSNGHSRNPA